MTTDVLSYTIASTFLLLFCVFIHIVTRVPHPKPTPTDVPSLAPSFSFRPTPLPTYAPTVVCTNGTYFIHPGTCEPCGIGRFSSYATTFEKKEQAPPWPEECTLCPVGQFQNAEGATSCNVCDAGKLSTENRTNCTKTQVRFFLYWLC